ncbi:MAG: hypothetical protein K8S16_11770, partial [Bacteroidales bacterium]|nr:hypothetical protein [Bacteroidales bacterium]
MKTLKFINLLLILSMIFSCSKNNEEDTNNNNNNSTGVLGEVGNVWKAKVDGTHDISAEVISKEDDIYTLEINFSKETQTVKFKFSNNEVIDYIYGEGDLTQPFTMVKFDANVGDIYSAEINGAYCS